ncbi:hypothetical protein BDW59DRAFT_173257 [Aspergillus cavernicola]|uniref:Mg2+ transporter protein n=1 Tax=Aspergillus cavernicola TaxID=176166 RepID=A0ABR4I7Q7_9EURO
MSWMFSSFVSSEFKKQNPQYKNRFQEEFFPVLEGDINGSFHCEYGCTTSRVWPAVSWSCFKVKEVKTATVYHWKQPTIHVDWDPETGRQVIHVFELSALQQNEFLKSHPSQAEQRCNPFTWHATFAHIILEQYDMAFWLLRNLVREQEKARSESSHEPNNFPLLHDIARHLFHYQETIEVAEHTMQALAAEQVRWRKEDPEKVREDLGTWLKTRQRLQYEEKRAHSLKTRSRSLNDRHQNEINLAFNLVSQRFGRDARNDSSMLTAISLVGMFYLPGTFVSGIFGTNFFSFQADPPNTWLQSSEFWIYWAVTIPLTLATMAIGMGWEWRDSFPDWWQKIRSSFRPSKDPDDPTTMNGGLELSASPSTLQRIATALRFRDVQRHETV